MSNLILPIAALLIGFWWVAGATGAIIAMVKTRRKYGPLPVGDPRRVDDVHPWLWGGPVSIWWALKHHD